MAVRIGMISFAHMHAESYAQCLKQFPDSVELAGVFDEDAQRGREAAQRHETDFVSSCDELLARDVQGVVIACENAKHRQYAEKAAAAGKHILCEKPISVGLPDAKAMIDACEDGGVQLTIAFPCRYSAPLFRARQLVKDGKLGKIVAMKGTNRGTMPGGWFTDKSLAGGGAVMDHTVHVVDLWRWMLSREVVSVYAEADRLFYNDIDVDDAGLLSLEFEGDVFATLDTSWSRPNNAFPTWGDVTMEIVGERGSIYVDAFKQHISIYNNDAVKAEWAGWTDDLNLGLIRAFLNVVANGEPSPITGYDGLKAMEAALGAYRSVEIGEPVSLPLAV